MELHYTAKIGYNNRECEIIFRHCLHRYIQQLKKVKKNFNTHYLDEFNWRLTTLCLTIENEAPNTTKFEFNYGAIGEEIFE